MSNRPLHFDNGAPPPPKPILTMEQLLDSAQTDWKFKRKDEAFAKVLGALAMMSAGVAQGMKTAEMALKEVERLEKIVRLHQEALNNTAELLKPDEPKQN